MSMLDIKEKETKKSKKVKEVKDVNGNGTLIVAVTCANLPEKSRPINWEGMKRVHDEADKLFIKRIELYIKLFENHPDYRLRYDRNTGGAVIAAVIETNPGRIVQMVTRSGSYNIFKSGIRQLLRKNGGSELGIK